MRVLAVAVALVLALPGVVVLARRRAADVWVWLAFAVGAAVFPIALLVREPITRLLSRALGPGAGEVAGVAGLVVVALVAAAIEETIKLTAAVGLLGAGRRDARAALAVGAAVGAGFGAYAAWSVLRGTFDLWRAAPALIGGSGLLLAIGLRLAGVLAHTATTALATLGAARGRTVAMLAAATVIQTALALLDGLYAVLGQTAASLIAIAGALLVFGYAYALASSGRAEAAPDHVRARALEPREG